MTQQLQNIDEFIDICKSSILAGRNQTVVYSQLSMLVAQSVNEAQRTRIIECIANYQQQYNDPSFASYYEHRSGAPLAPLPPQPQVQAPAPAPPAGLIQPSALEDDLDEADVDFADDGQEAMIRSIRTPADFFAHVNQINRVVNFVFAKLYKPWKGIELPANPQIDVSFDSKTGEKFIRLRTAVNCISIDTFSAERVHALAARHYAPSKNQPGKYVGRFLHFSNTFYLSVEEVGVKFATVENRRKGITITQERFEDFFGPTITDALQKVIP